MKKSIFTNASLCLAMHSLFTLFSTPVFADGHSPAPLIFKVTCGFETHEVDMRTDRFTRFNDAGNEIKIVLEMFGPEVKIVSARIEIPNEDSGAGFSSRYGVRQLVLSAYRHNPDLEIYETSCVVH